jgi:hypothetical protein
MNTSRTTRFAGFLMAVTMAVAVNGAVLLMFNSVGQDTYASKSQPQTIVTLATVTVASHRS